MEKTLSSLLIELLKYPFRNVSNDRQKHWSDIQCAYAVTFIHRSESMLTQWSMKKEEKEKGKLLFLRKYSIIVKTKLVIQ